MKPLLTALLFAGLALPGAAGAECVGRVLLPPTESVRTTQVLVSPSRIERLRIPAEVRRAQRAVLVRPGRVERLRWAAEYRVERRWESLPGPVRLRRGPDRYETVAERVLVAPGHAVWERRAGPLVSGPPEPGQTIVTPTGVVMCKVWCPAVYRTVLHPVRVGPGRPVAIRTVVRREVDRRILVRPAGEAVRRIPAEYRWVSTERLVSPAREVLRRIPARYALRSEREVQGGGSAYAPVVCGGPLSRPAMARMQSSLAAQGYDAGPADGLGRPQTYEALHRFQVEHRLAAGQVTVESARALGVIP